MVSPDATVNANSYGSVGVLTGTSERRIKVSVVPESMTGEGIDDTLCNKGVVVSAEFKLHEDVLIAGDTATPTHQALYEVTFVHPIEPATACGLVAANIALVTMTS